MAHPLKSILATTDLTGAAEAGLRTAASVGEASRAPVHVVHCVRHAGPFGQWDAQAGLTRQSTAEEALRRQVELVLGPEWSPASACVRLGAPSAVISERATEVAANLIVLGGHQPRRAFDGLLGTTADRVIRTAHVPCLLAHAPVRFPVQRVLVATDFSPPAQNALDVIVDWVSGPAGSETQPGVLIELLCVSVIAGPEYQPLDMASRLESEAERARSRLGLATTVEVRERIYSEQFAVDGIARVADEIEADLVALGTHGYNPVARFLLGSVAYTVVRTVLDPVLLVPLPDTPTEG